MTSRTSFSKLRNGHAVLGAADPRRVNFEERLDRAQVRRPPPSPSLGTGHSRGNASRSGRNRPCGRHAGPARQHHDADRRTHRTRRPSTAPEAEPLTWSIIPRLPPSVPRSQESRNVRRGAQPRTALPSKPQISHRRLKWRRPHGIAPSNYGIRGFAGARGTRFGSQATNQSSSDQGLGSSTTTGRYNRRRESATLSNQISRLLGDHDDRSEGVSARDGRHDRGVSDPQAVHPIDAE
jgi:hypothetical protein